MNQHLRSAWARRIESSEDYQTGHQPPDDSDPLYDLGSTGLYFPSDVYENPEVYAYGARTDYARESIRVIKEVRGKPDAMVTIYRAAPPGLGSINTGDWVAVARSYAQMHLESNGKSDWKVYSASVPARTIRCGENDLIEYGYWGPSVSARTAKLAAWDDDPELQKALEDLANAIVSSPGKSYDFLPPSHEMYGGLIYEARDGTLQLDGQPLKKLYRVVHPKEWEDAQRNGYLQSDSPYSKGYTRASAKPDERWRYQSADQMEAGTRGHTLEIDYDPADAWHASAEGYAATHSRIPLSRVRKLS